MTVGQTEGGEVMGDMMEEERWRRGRKTRRVSERRRGREVRRKWRGKEEKRCRSEREGMTRTMKVKLHPPPTSTIVTGLVCVETPMT